jgi:hypothetical protein
VGVGRHVVNGVDGAFLYAAHQVYDPITNMWSNLAAPNIPAAGNYYSQDSGCTFIGGKMYLYGGYGLTDSGPTSVAGEQELTWVYDPAADTWADTGKVMTGSAYLWSAFAASPTTAYVSGGVDVATFAPHNNTQSFTPAGGWVAGAALPQPLAGSGAGVIANRVIVWGGSTSAGTMSNKTYACSLPACAAYMATAFNLPTAKGYFAWGTGSSLYSAGGFNDAFATLTAAEHLP